MKRLIDFFIDRPLIVNLITFIIILIGLISVITIQKDMFPKVEFGVITVTTAYPGSSAEDVEKLVTIELERELRAVEGIKELHAVSAENNSIITVVVEPDYDLKTVLQDVKDAVDSVEDLPEDVKISRVKNRTNTSKSAISIALYGEDYGSLKKSARDLRDKLENYNKISQIDFNGMRSDEIMIQVDPVKLNYYELTIGEVARAIQNRNINLSAGQIQTGSTDLIIRTISEFQSHEEIKDVVIRSNDTGKKVLIRDIANVIRRAEKGTVLTRVQGEESIVLKINIKSNADIISSTTKVKEITEAFFKQNNSKFLYQDDMSYFVKRRLNVLSSNGLFGIALVLGCLLLFLNLRTSIVTSMGAPIAFMVAFSLMGHLGISLNLISMFGLILVLGMLVDDSIIVAEQFYQKLEEGMKPYDAAKEAAYETLAPVTATIITTMIAFGALFFMGGIMGKFLWPVPAVVIICLAASWIECFFILPSHLAEFCTLKKPKKMNWYIAIKDRYKKTLNFCLRHSFKTSFVFLIVLITSLAIAKKMRFELFPGDDVRVVFLQAKGTVGDPLEKTNEAAIRLEKMVMSTLSKEELNSLVSNVGKLNGQHGNKAGTHYLSLITYLSSPEDRERSTEEIIKELESKAKKILGESYTVTIKKVQGGPPRKSPVEIELSGKSLDDLKTVSKKVLSKLLTIQGVIGEEIDYEEGKKQVVIKVDEFEAKRLGLSTHAVALELRQAFAEDEISEIRESDEDVQIKVVLNKAARSKIDTITDLFILNNQGKRIPLNRVIKIENSPGAFVIRRLDGKRIFSVSANINRKLTTPIKVKSEMRPIVSEIVKDYENINFSFGGENQNTKESMEGLLKSFVIAILCIFLVLVLMFGSLGQPIIVMSAIPLGLIGVVFAFLLFGKSLGFMALMGVVGLVGVVVNDSIVLVNCINKEIKDVETVDNSIVDAALSRLRPVLLTTITTVAGLLPVAHAPGGDPFIKPMALSFAWGLLFATFVTLIFIPASYKNYYVSYHYLLGKFKKLVK